MTDQNKNSLEWGSFGPPEENDETKERPAVIFRVAEKTDKGEYVGYYVTMPGGGRKLVYGNAPTEEEVKDAHGDTSYRASVPSPEELKEVLDANGVKSAEELRGLLLEKEL